MIVLADFYFFAKSPPWSDYHVIVHSEGTGAGWSINCGFIYLQNTQPNGPSVWALADAIIRSVRWSSESSGIIALGMPGEVWFAWVGLMPGKVIACLGRPHAR